MSLARISEMPCLATFIASFAGSNSISTAHCSYDFVSFKWTGLPGSVKPWA